MSLQRLAITDDLTGLANGRYFRHFLAKTIDKAKVMRFPVTLFLFDIDNFKKYNDQFGHCVGDEILKQTATLMRRCVRDHDLVARISGDEFAVVFWEMEGPRQPRDPKAPPAAGRDAAGDPGNSESIPPIAGDARLPRPGPSWQRSFDHQRRNRRLSVGCAGCEWINRRGG